MTAVLDARNLSKVFNGQPALAAADLIIEPGEIRALDGANGSGKSTLVKILAGVYEPEPGASLEVAGERVGFGPRDSEAAGLRFVHQDLGLSGLSTRSTISLWVTGTGMCPGARSRGRVLGMDAHVDKGVLRAAREKADVQNWLRRLQVLPSRTEAIMGSLSGGNQQKVILSRWLRHRLKVLLLDDPTQGVDVGSRAEIHELIIQVARERMSVLIASSDHEELALLCNRVVIMSRGNLQQTLYAPDVTADHITVCTVSAGGRDTEASPTTDRPTGGRSIHPHNTLRRCVSFALTKGKRSCLDAWP